AADCPRASRRPKARCGGKVGQLIAITTGSSGLTSAPQFVSIIALIPALLGVMGAQACTGGGAERLPEFGPARPHADPIAGSQTHVCALKRPIFVQRNATTKAKAPIDPTSAWPIRIQRVRMSWMGWMVSVGIDGGPPCCVAAESTLEAGSP